MKKLLWISLTMLLLVGASPRSLATGGSLVVDHTSLTAFDRIPPQYLEGARSLAVLFGHQSVGDNILMGLQALSPQDPSHRLNILSNPNPGALATSRGVGEFRVGRNGDPDSKFAHFQSMFTQRGFGDQLDVAMMKLCFVDLQGRQDPVQAFQTYRTTMESLEREYPRIRFVWWTSPLCLGGNQSRHLFNQQIRQYCLSHGQILFDLADLESHGPQGQESNQAGVPCLAQPYSRDGGHLNPLGATQVARAWWCLMAHLAGWPG